MYCHIFPPCAVTTKVILATCTTLHMAYELIIRWMPDDKEGHRNTFCPNSIPLHWNQSLPYYAPCIFFFFLASLTCFTATRNSEPKLMENTASTSYNKLVPFVYFAGRASQHRRQFRWTLILKHVHKVGFGFKIPPMNRVTDVASPSSGTSAA